MSVINVSPLPSTLKSRLLSWRILPTVAVLVAIFVLSAQPGSELDGWMPWFASWLPGLHSFDPMHYVAYFGLALAVAYALGDLSRRFSGAIGNVLFCVLYGATDEWHQSFVPNRSPDLHDLQHDAIGAAAAAFLVLVILRISQNNLSRSKNYTPEAGRRTARKPRI